MSQNLWLVILGGLLAILAAVLIILTVAYLRTRKRVAPLVSLDDELARVRRELARKQGETQQFVVTAEQQRATLTAQYREAATLYESLKREVGLLEENLEDISFGIYKPHFAFETSAAYKAKLEQLHEKELELVRAGKAATCDAEWEVAGSKKEGARMAKQNTKLVLRAFNGEADAAIAKVTWNNVTKMEERIVKAFEAINKLGSVLRIAVTPEYLDVKLTELRLTHEMEDKRNQEREEQRRIREQMREEERVQREAERAKLDAEKEEDRYEKALEKARTEAAAATGEELRGMEERVHELENQLEEAHRRKERALSQAQQTRQGHVYVISNEGSFGERVYKVGMTRRLEPYERIQELGDASVPFPFDIHAMIFSEDAPAFESELHEFLGERRINLVNQRKEFFSVSLAEIETFVKSRKATVEFTMVAEAREFRETIALRGERNHEPASAPSAAFPANPFKEASTASA